ncbi:SDR family oxidoreductase [Gemmata sp. JC717]|uniref:SDR family NAD(P)-dependent oxidoreductase n=1 Tax=Gemmata algarum TaxID=2975278 RepID=UPI0021BA845C|nr:SDR family oxidoreductase [Gemmata algarum]MDY3552681.1 SDR family oxidoreductase [Gemmata algarum]
MGHRLRERYGPWAVVTGASSGIGRSLAEQLAAAGLNTVLVSRSAEVLDHLAADLRNRYAVEARPLPLDLAGGNGIEPLAEATAALDVGLLVASAGFGTSGAFLDSTLADELAMLDLNCRATVAQSWHFGKRFAARGRGGMILFGSVVGFQGTPYAAHYAATKAYIQSLGEALSVELAPFGVDVLTAAPGPTRSGFAARAGMTMGAALDPDTVAGSILAALGRRPTVLPGLLSKLLAYSTFGLPRWARVRIMGRVMRKMSAHPSPARSASPQ